MSLLFEEDFFDDAEKLLSSGIDIDDLPYSEGTFLPSTERSGISTVSFNDTNTKPGYTPKLITNHNRHCALIFELKGKELRPYNDKLDIYVEYEYGRSVFLVIVNRESARDKTIFYLHCIQRPSFKFEIWGMRERHNMPEGYELPMKVLDLSEYSSTALKNGRYREEC